MLNWKKAIKGPPKKRKTFLKGNNSALMSFMWESWEAVCKNNKRL